MKKIALCVEYIGTNYCGWQRQSHCASVQEQVETALASIAAHKVDVHCAGRTDTGVHSIGQIVHFETHVIRPNKAWVQGVNTQLPGDIRIRWAKEVADNFHARFSAVARQYRYVIYNREVHSAVLNGRVTWEPYKLDESLMNEAAQSLLGENDFSSFRASACQASHAMRELQSINVSRKGDMVFIDIQANAFLHHMVRNITGTLVEVGKKHQPVSWVAELLQAKDRTLAAATAPASGLFFVNAIYPPTLHIPQVVIDEVLWQ